MLVLICEASFSSHTHWFLKKLWLQVREFLSCLLERRFLQFRGTSAPHYQIKAHKLFICRCKIMITLLLLTELVSECWYWEIWCCRGFSVEKSLLVVYPNIMKIMNLASHAVCFLLDLCKAWAKFLVPEQTVFQTRLVLRVSSSSGTRAFHWHGPVPWPHPSWWLQPGSLVPQGPGWEWKSFPPRNINLC